MTAEDKWFEDVKSLHDKVSDWTAQTKHTSVYWKGLFRARNYLADILAAQKSVAEKYASRKSPYHDMRTTSLSSFDDTLAGRVGAALYSAVDEILRKEPFDRFGKAGTKRGVVPKDYDFIRDLVELIQRAVQIWSPVSTGPDRVQFEYLARDLSSYSFI